MSARIFDVPSETVVAAAACTWCGAGLADPCRERDGSPTPIAPHAQRWYDYYNATSERRAHRPVLPAPWCPR